MAHKANECTLCVDNNNSLQHHLRADAVSAVIAATAISPVITAVDRSVVESVSTGRPLLRTLGKHLLCPFTNPRLFFATKPVFVVWTLYATTYLTANTTDTLAERYLQADEVLTGTLISSAVFTSNTPLGIWKDVRFTQFSGNRLATAASTAGHGHAASRSGAAAIAAAATASAAVPRRMPASVSAAFLVRDIITVFGAFAIAPQVAAAVPDSVAGDAQDKAAAAQLLVPAATPAHLLALDLYNRPGPHGLVDRTRTLRAKYLSTTAMRAVRLVPAFGVGIIFNSRLRLSLEGSGQDG